MLNSLRTPPFSLGQLTSLGIEPEKCRVLVVKAAVAYKAAYAPIARRIIEVDTPGDGRQPRAGSRIEISGGRFIHWMIHRSFA